MEAPYHPNDPSLGTRKIPFSRVIYIERNDFEETPPKGFFRLTPGQEVRLRYAYFIKCQKVIKDGNGDITEIHCTYDPETYGGNAKDGRKVKGTIHWVSAEHAVKTEVRLYDRLFSIANPASQKDTDYKSSLNPDSLKILPTCFVEPSLASAKSEEKYQFERLGYFCVDYDSKETKIIFNRTVTLKDTWVKNKNV